MSDRQFEVGQLLSYGTNGICIVDDIKLVKLTAGMKPEMYYILKQKRDSESKIFVPVNNEKLTSRMRELMNREEIDDLLMGMNDEIIAWDTNRRSRNELFHSILAEGVSMDLLRMITCIYEHKADLTKNGKKLPVTDANTLKSAERLVTEEFSCVLGIEQEDVNKYINNVIGKSNAS